MRHIYPGYMHAESAIARLEAGQSISPQDEGFGDLSAFFLQNIAEYNHIKNLPDDVRVDAIKPGVGVRLAGKLSSLVVVFSVSSSATTLKQTTASINIYFLSNKLSTEREKRLFRLSWLVVFIGFGIGILGLAIELRDIFTVLYEVANKYYQRREANRGQPKPKGPEQNEHPEAPVHHSFTVDDNWD
jgi:hypothetical protein